MTYLVLSAIVLVLVLVFVACTIVIKRPRHLGRATLAAAITAVVLFVLTAVFDSLMIAAGLMEYTSAHLVGWYIGLAPIEDFSYPLAAVLLLPALWLACAPRTRYRRHPAPVTKEPVDAD